MKNFRTLNLAVDFYHQARRIPAEKHVRNQLLRAAHSIVLNLAEARGKPTLKDQKRFFSISLGSLRECQAILLVERMQESEEWELLDKLGAHIYKLIQNSHLGIAEGS
jgi:four helix bundle protein